MDTIRLRNAIRTGLFLLAGTLLPAARVQGQIQFEKSFNYSGAIANLEKEGPKFYLMDATTNQCRIYNLDWTLWKTIPLQIPIGLYLYDIQFVSQNLFDTDDGVELLYVFYQYVQTSTSYYYIYTTRIADESGSILLDLPGCSWTSIRNIEGSGSRMLCYVMDYSVYPYPVETRVYRLPGSVAGTGEPPVSGEAGGTLFPNPTDGPVRIDPSVLPLTDPAEWVVMTLTGDRVARVPVKDPGKPLDLKSLGLPAGTYLVRLESKQYQTKFQQIVLSN